MRSKIILTSFFFAIASIYAFPQTTRGESAISGKDAVVSIAKLSDKSNAGRLTGNVGYTKCRQVVSIPYISLVLIRK
ncbi:MAG: hypothetical protein LBB40_02910 [Holophagales bacterium]|nr:hypothetical protein [Holophagales bacterium]